ncbi:MAG: hypothetical protein M0Z94_11960, partial [Dehalococcoidales bacterium]|nr:hypothetical protein [Dehalococcoidales bacterium]
RRRLSARAGLVPVAAMAALLAPCGGPAQARKAPTAQKAPTGPVQMNPPATAKASPWPSGAPAIAELRSSGPAQTERLSAVDFVSAQVGFVLRADCSGSGACIGTLLETSDAGAEWRTRGQVPVSGGIAFLSAQQGFAWGAGGLYATANGGAQWTRIYQGSVNEASFLTPTIGWIGIAGMNCATQGCPFEIEGT